MQAVQFHQTAKGRRLAYHLTAGTGPTVVFLGGLKSDMDGTKALHLEDWARRRGQAFLRFDYSGHGQSSGAFEDGAIGDWAEDTRDILKAVITGPVLAVGSSMGGWQALLLARAMPERLVGLVTIAAAPDFTEDSYWSGFTEAQKTELEQAGRVEIPSDYMEPYVITKRMIEDGRENLVLRESLRLPFPVRCLQGTADTAVSMDVALRLLNHANSSDMQLTLVKDADHRFSDDACLALIETAIEEILLIGNG